MNFKTLRDRLKNVGTLVSIASGVVLIATSLGFKVDNNEIMTIVKTLCSIGVTLGVLNNPDSVGLDIPGLPDKNNANNK